MYKNCVFDLYGTLIDINTDEWSIELWEKMAVYYGYKGAIYTAEELNEEYGKLVEAEKKAVHRRHKDYSVIDIKIDKVFKKLYNQKGVKVTKAVVEQTCAVFRCFSTKYIKLYDGVTEVLDALKANGKKIYLLSNAQRSFTANEMDMLGLTKYFDGICISSDEECSKPDSHYFEILFDRYELLSELGSGAAGKVYLARHLKLETYRAIKCISKTRSMPSSILSEANILAKLRHPGIPIVYDIEEDEAFYYIIEEYVEGESLEKLLWNTSVSQEYMIQIGIQLCGIVSFLHSQKPFPVLHQDLKPSHIIVCGNQVKLIDFGIASYITSRGKNYQNYGTKGFAAPEQYGEYELHTASDIYAIGAVFSLYIKKHSHKSSPAFRHIAQKATRKNPNKRYKSAGELQQALTRALKQKGNRKEHLLKSISVVGAESGVGTTHIAIALTSFFNAGGANALYREIQSEKREKISNVVEQIGRSREAECEEDIVICRNFRGSESIGSGEDTLIFDYGAAVEEACMEEAEITVLVVNLSLWKREASMKAWQTLRCVPNLKIICNHSSPMEAREFAAFIGREVYCYPRDTMPFDGGREKEAFFTQMLSKEGRR